MPTGVLASYWYYKAFDFDKIPKHCPLILDSGAFSAYTSGGVVQLDEFGEWALQVQSRRDVDFMFNLDVLGDEAQSLANWHRLRGMGVHTIPVIHYGTHPQDALPAYLAEGADRVALGGLATGSATPQVIGWVATVLRWLRDNAPETKTHGLGIHMRSKLAQFDWTTTDSSRVGTAWRFGQLNLWTGRRWVSVHLNGKDLYRYGKIVRQYGFDPDKVAKAKKGTYMDVVHFAARVEVQAAVDRANNNNGGRGVTRRYMVDTWADAFIHLALEAASQHETHPVRG